MAILATSNTSTMAQAPTTPWCNEQEAEEYAADPKKFMLERCRLWMNSARFLHNVIVAATYYLPPFGMLGGKKFYLPDSTQNEGLHQGKVGLVVGKGPLAFVDDERVKFAGENVEIGDWIQWDIHDARPFTINRIHCRRLPDTKVFAVLDNPRLVY